MRALPGARMRTESRRAYTLIEMLIIVVLLGIAGAVVIPSMARTSVLRVQAAVRTIVSDITFVQSDAMAFQARRVVVFGRIPQWDPATLSWQSVPGNGYTVYALPPNAALLDLQNDMMFDPNDHSVDPEPFGRDFNDTNFAGAVIENVNFNGDELLIFDELGGPVEQLTGDAPGVTGVLEIQGQDTRFRLNVEAFTGRVTVTRLQ